MWWQNLIAMVVGGALVFGGVWTGHRITKGESIIPRRPKPPPVPTYDRPERRELPPEVDGMGMREFVEETRG